MAALRCSICATNYPTGSGLQSCPRCESRLDHINNAEPHGDWRERSSERDERSTAEAQSVYAWRRERFERLGFSAAVARTLADAPVDLAYADHVVSDLGCPLSIAPAILI